MYYQFFTLEKIFRLYDTSLYVQCKTIKKIHVFLKIFREFSILILKFLVKIKFYRRQIFEILIIHKPFLGSHSKFGPDRFSRFDVLDTNGQTDR